MQVYLNDLDELTKQNNLNTAIALGRFDAMHPGHIEIISKAVKYARENNIKSLVYMFSNNPIEVITGIKIPSVNSLERRLRLLEGLGVDVVVAEEFNSVIMNMSCEDFVNEYLKKKFGAKYVAVGYNYNFGKGGEGDTGLLRILCGDNIEVCVTDEVKIRDKSVSSTIIRGLISEGEVGLASELMDRPHMLSGEVIRGNGIGGSKLGFPTANIALPDNSILPGFGVYITRTTVLGNAYPSITNIGGKPTIDNKSCLIETYIEGEFNELYGQAVEIEFCEKIRDIVRFNSMEELKAQLKADREKMIEYFKEV